jgi:hypothetical protein
VPFDWEPGVALQETVTLIGGVRVAVGLVVYFGAKPIRP